MPLRNEAGQLVLWVGTCTDIDDQKRTEEALRQSQERVNLLMNSSIIGIFYAEGDEIVDANATFLRMTGYSREDLQQGNVHWATLTLPPASSFPQEVYEERGEPQKPRPEGGESGEPAPRALLYTSADNGRPRSPTVQSAQGGGARGSLCG